MSSRGRCGRPLGPHVEKVDEEVVGQRLTSRGENAEFALLKVGVQDAKSPDEYRHLGRTQRQQTRSVQEQIFRGATLTLTEVVSKPSVVGSSTAKDSMSVSSCVASVRPGVKGTSTSRPTVFSRLLNGRATGEHDDVGERNSFSVRTRRIEGTLNPSRVESTVPSSVGLLTSQSFLGRQANACTVGPTALVSTAERGRRCPRRIYQLPDRQIRRENGRLQFGDLGVTDEFVGHRGQRVLPNQWFAGTQGPR